MFDLGVRVRMNVLSAAMLLSSGPIAVAQPVAALPGYSVSLLAAGFDWPSGLAYTSGHHDLLVCQQNANKI